MLSRTWLDFYKQPLDQMPSNRVAAVRENFFEWPWNRVYDYIEFVAGAIDDWDRRRRYMEFANSVLRRELAGWRFIDEKLVPIGTEEERTAIETARRDASQLVGVHAHLTQAAVLLADRDSPDYRNSIKESISAVEAVCQVLSGKRGTIGQCLKTLDPVWLHPALKGAFEKLYGWTSDAQGIRHALMDEPNLTVDDARFVLVSCSAFVSYLIAKAAPMTRE